MATALEQEIGHGNAAIRSTENRRLSSNPRLLKIVNKLGRSLMILPLVLKRRVPESDCLAAGSHRPYENLVDADQLEKLEKVVPGGAERVLDMIKQDMDRQAEWSKAQDLREHKAFLLAIWVTAGLVLLLTGIAALVFVAGHAVAGGVLVAVDLAALANILVNSWRRPIPPAT